MRPLQPLSATALRLAETDETAVYKTFLYTSLAKGVYQTGVSSVSSVSEATAEPLALRKEEAF